MFTTNLCCTMNVFFPTALVIMWSKLACKALNVFVLVFIWSNHQDSTLHTCANLRSVPMSPSLKSQAPVKL